MSPFARNPEDRLCCVEAQIGYSKQMRNNHYNTSTGSSNQ